ncbi:MAG TPA: ubiquitin-like domain-containing protein [Anaerolineales bacterium]|nr:ubiquitin-like domain-containing protein [Anaerolineales bacterium]
MQRAVFVLFLILSGAGWQTAAPETLPVTVYADGRLHRGISPGASPAYALAAAGVVLAEGDAVFLDGLPLDPGAAWGVEDGGVIQVQRAGVLSWEGGRITTTAATVGAALLEAGVILRVGDRVEPSPETTLAGALTVSLAPARPVTTQIGGRELTIWTAAGTVGEALREGGLSLQGLDYSLPPAEAAVPPEDEVRVVRVEEEILLEQVTLAFDTLTQPAPDLEIDTQQVVQVGAFGLQVSRIRVRYEDGVEVERRTEAEWIAAQPQPRIVGYGTNIVVRTMNTPDGPIEYYRTVQAFATSYSPCRLGIDACGNTTASGLQLEKGMVAVIRSWYNAMVFSQVYVPGYGVGVIADIGAGVSGGHWIDLGYSDEDWVSWSQTVTVYFLTPIPPPEQILWILP